MLATPRFTTLRRDGRAGLVAIRTEHAAIAVFGFELLIAPFAIIEKQAGIHRHDLVFPVSALGTGEGRGKELPVFKDWAWWRKVGNKSKRRDSLYCRSPRVIHPVTYKTWGGTGASA